LESLRRADSTWLWGFVSSAASVPSTPIARRIFDKTLVAASGLGAMALGHLRRIDSSILPTLPRPKEKSER
jgi:hypothetical protein